MWERIFLCVFCHTSAPATWEFNFGMFQYVLLYTALDTQNQVFLNVNICDFSKMLKQIKHCLSLSL